VDQINIIGNVGFVGEERTVTVRGEQTTVTDVVVIVNKTYKQGNKRVEKSKSYTVPFWGALSDVAQQHIEVGQTLRVTGEVLAAAYADKNGDPAAKLKIAMSPLRPALGVTWSVSEESIANLVHRLGARRTTSLCPVVRALHCLDRRHAFDRNGDRSAKVGAVDAAAGVVESA